MNAPDAALQQGTGCVDNVQVLQQLQPSVMFIEEAAEMLESQIVSSLTAKVQQLVLLGMAAPRALL